jgi:signal transduction histidine kinase
MCRPREPAARARLTAMSAMASTMAHELSQPLSAASSFYQTSIQALRQTVAGIEDVIALIENAGAQTMRAADLVRQMRSFVVSGTVMARPEDLRAMVAQASGELRGFDGVELTTDFGPAATHVLVDRIQIETVLANLLRNAAQALHDRLVQRIRLSTELADGAVFVRIEDSGPGIPDDERGQLFEPLYTTRADGTGLGLSICRTIVEAHDGALWLEPYDSRAGAVFVLVLPAAATE